MGGTCQGLSGGFRPSVGGRTNTRSGFGRLTRTCRILDSNGGHTTCSRCKRTDASPGFNTNNNCNNNFNNFSNNFRSVFSSFFKNNNKHNEGPGTPHRNSSLRCHVRLAFRRTVFKGGRAVHCGHSRRYGAYDNSNTGPNARPGAYSGYRNSKTVNIRQGAPFNHIVARSIYSIYNKANGRVASGYAAYRKRKRIRASRSITIAVPPNISSKRRVHLGKRNRINDGNNPCNSLCIIFRIRPDSVFSHRKARVRCALPVDFTRTTLNSRIRIPAMRNGIGLGVPTKARANADFHLGNGKTPHLHKAKGNSRRIGIAIIAPGGLGRGRGRTVHTFTATNNSALIRSRSGFFSGIGSTFGGGGWVGKVGQYFMGGGRPIRFFTPVLFY